LFCKLHAAYAADSLESLEFFWPYRFLFDGFYSAPNWTYSANDILCHACRHRVWLASQEP
jgi:hypothetical protein